MSLMALAHDERGYARRSRAWLHLEFDAESFFVHKTPMSKTLSDPDRAILASFAAQYPVTGLLHVGAWQPGWQEMFDIVTPEAAILVEPDRQHFDRLSEIYCDHPSIEIRQLFIAGQAGQATYYQATLDYVSGRLDPTGLKGIWQNIERVSDRQLDAMTLDEFFTSVGPRINWLLLNCIDAADLLRGAEQALADVDIVCAQAILDAGAASDLKRCSKDALDNLMFSRGFKLIFEFAERPPQIARCLYARDWKGELGSENQLLAERYQEAIQRVTQYATATDAAKQKASTLNDALSAISRKEDGGAASMVDEIMRLTEELESKTERLATIERALARQTADCEQRVKVIEKDAADARKRTEHAAASLEKELGLASKQIVQLERQVRLQEPNGRQMAGDPGNAIERARQAARETIERLDAELEHKRDQVLRLQTEAAAIEENAAEAAARQKEALKQAQAEAREADQRRQLSDSNLADLQKRYEVLADTNSDQAKCLADVAAELAIARDLLLKEQGGQATGSHTEQSRLPETSDD